MQQLFHSLIDGDVTEQSDGEWQRFTASVYEPWGRGLVFQNGIHGRIYSGEDNHCLLWDSMSKDIRRFGPGARRMPELGGFFFP